MVVLFSRWHQFSNQYQCEHWQFKVVHSKWQVPTAPAPALPTALPMAQFICNGSIDYHMFGIPQYADGNHYTTIYLHIKFVY